MKLFLKIMLLFLVSSSLWAKKGDIKSVFIYYGTDLAYDIAGSHDAIIVQPYSIETYTHRFKTYRNKIYTYVSVGELDDKTHKEWILGENKNWDSFVADIRIKAYQDYLLKKMKKLQKRGFKNFFFDTIDSYQMFLKDKKGQKSYENAMVDFFARVDKKFPNSKLIINRGFEIIDRVAKYCDGFLVESLYHGLDTKNKTYKKMKKNDITWLLGKLEKVKKYDLDIIVLDYLPLTDKIKVQESIKKISSLGFTPYIGSYNLESVGKSSITPFKREILIFYNSKTEPGDDKVFVRAHRLLATPLEYLGYIPILWDLQTKGFPKRFDNYAGVIVSMAKDLKDLNQYYSWVQSVIKSGVRILLLSDASIPNSTHLKKLGITVTVNEDKLSSDYPIIQQDDMIGYETKPLIRYRYNFYNPKNSKVILASKNSKGVKSVLSAITPWGGYVLNSSYMSFFREDIFWNIDPFKLFKQALKLKDFPIPDIMTKNGKRLLWIHIDGDGLVSGVEFKTTPTIAAQQLLESVVKKYDLPHSISIIEGEVSKKGVYPKFSEIATKYARKIFKQPNVLVASHTYSHPFNWAIVEKNPTITGHNLPVKNFRFSAKRELSGSLDFINKNLAPKDKKAKTVFWSGNCLPSENVLRYASKNNILAINGGETVRTQTKNSLEKISPIGIRRGKYYQIYAAVENENVFTNDWLGPYWGYELAIQTFQMTEKPIRIKPINIYYHFYITTKMASLNSLRKVYKWALSQEINPIYVTEYIQKAHNFYYASVAKKGDRYIFGGLKYIDELRLPKNLGFVDIQNSKGVVGFKDKYVHLNSKKVSLKFQNQDKNRDNFYLIETNGEIKKWTKNQISIESNIAIKAKFNLPKRCKITKLNGYKIKKGSNEIDISSTKIKKLTFNYECN